MLGLVSDLLLVSATLGLAFWCRMLSRRLALADSTAGKSAAPSVAPEAVAALEHRLAQLDAAISAQASQTADRAARLDEANRQADDRIGRMEMLLASLEDLEEESADRLLGDDARRRDPLPAMPEEQIPSFRAARNMASGGRN